MEPSFGAPGLFLEDPESVAADIFPAQQDVFQTGCCSTSSRCNVADWNLLHLSPNAEPFTYDSHDQEGYAHCDPPCKMSWKSSISPGDKKMNNEDSGREVQAFFSPFHYDGQQSRARQSIRDEGEDGQPPQHRIDADVRCVQQVVQRDWLAGSNENPHEDC